eukprot:131457-Chlamydomonas_euryale.AAC.2
MESPPKLGASEVEGSQLLPCGFPPQLTLPMSNQNLPLRAILMHSQCPSTAGSVYGPSTPARTCHIVHVRSEACGGLSASRRQCGRDS